MGNRVKKEAIIDTFLFFFLSLVLIGLLPVLFGQLMVAALTKLHLAPDAIMALVMAIIFGGFINLPIKRIVRDQPVTTHPLRVYGLHGLAPQWQREHSETIIAVNVGGCIVPSLLALYELAHLDFADPQLLTALVVVVGVNIFACFRFSKPVAGVGIVMPTRVSPLVASVGALLLCPEQAAPVAFIAGVSGPLIGADLLHLKKIEEIAVGTASIGGAGTFDGIVLSGIIAAYLA